MNQPSVIAAKENTNLKIKIGESRLKFALNSITKQNAILQEELVNRGVKNNMINKDLTQASQKGKDLGKMLRSTRRKVTESQDKSLVRQLQEEKRKLEMCENECMFLMKRIVVFENGKFETR